MSIRIVTDSACDVPEHLAYQLGITTVPVYINIGEKSYLEGVEISRQEFYDNLANYPVYPTTAAPSVGAFTETYERLVAEGATEIISIHLSSHLSATYNSARLGAEAANTIPVTLFDTKQLTLAAGLLVMMAAEMAVAGHTKAEIIQMLEDRVSRTRIFGMIDNLEALRRSGRVSWAQFGLGTLLNIKPLMMIFQAEIQVLARIRTYKRAVSQLVKMVDDFGPFERLVNAPQAAEELKQQAEHLFPEGHPLLAMNITPAIGTHFGVGAIGFAGISEKKTKIHIVI